MSIELINSNTNESSEWERPADADACVDGVIARFSKLCLDEQSRSFASKALKPLSSNEVNSVVQEVCNLPVQDRVTALQMRSGPPSNEQPADGVDDGLDDFMETVEALRQPAASSLSLLYNRAHSLIKEELKLAEEEGKKLLIIVGEGHSNPKSSLTELILCAAANDLGIHTVLTETATRSVIDDKIARPFNWKRGYGLLVMAILAQMGWNFYSVDPLHEIMRPFVSAHKTVDMNNPEVNNAMVDRNLAINNAIANLSSNSHSIFIVGNQHLPHLVDMDFPEVKLLEAYRRLPITTLKTSSPFRYTPSGPVPMDGNWFKSHTFTFVSEIEEDWLDALKAMSLLPGIHANKELVATLEMLESNTSPFISFKDGKLLFCDMEDGKTFQDKSGA